MFLFKDAATNSHESLLETKLNCDEVPKKLKKFVHRVWAGIGSLGRVGTSNICVLVHLFQCYISATIILEALLLLLRSCVQLGAHSWLELDSSLL